MNTYLKIGELAKITGITVRTLHYYDEIGLLKPSEVTDSGHRLYGTQSLNDLYRIIAMKEMGFPLDEIKNLLVSDEIKISELIDLQMFRLQEEISQKQLLFSKILKVKQNLIGNGDILVEDFQDMMQFINTSADKFFTLEQFKLLKKKQQNLDSKSDSSQEWYDFITKLDTCYRKNLPKSSPLARECAEFWNHMTRMFIGADEQLQKSIQTFHASSESNSMKYGLTNELYQYLTTIIN